MPFLYSCRCAVGTLSRWQKNRHHCRFRLGLSSSVWRQDTLRQDMNTGSARADFRVAAEPASVSVTVFDFPGLRITAAVQIDADVRVPELKADANRFAITC